MTDSDRQLLSGLLVPYGSSNSEPQLELDYLELDYFVVVFCL